MPQQLQDMTIPEQMDFFLHLKRNKYVNKNLLSISCFKHAGDEIQKSLCILELWVLDFFIIKTVFFPTH